MAVVLFVPRGALAGGEPDVDALMARANEDLTAGDFDAALDLFSQASELRPESAEIAYNQGVAHYRNGDYARATELFTKALTYADASLDARMKYNLANCAYAEALSQADDPAAAIKQVRRAMAYYRDTIASDPGDADARANIELAHRLLKELEEKQQHQEQEQQDEGEQDEQEQEQEEQQPSSQPSSQPTSQPSSQPSEEQRQQQQEGEGESSEEQQKQATPGEEGESGEEQEQPMPQPQPHEGKMSQAEAERLLQLVRDKERLRREMLKRRERAKRVPVEKDW
ncbi:MAG: tetratricopeptide repeat protein [Phycisphaerae bacterium]